MPITFIATLAALLFVTLLLAKVFNMPRNVWILFLVQPLALSVYPVMVFIGGILSTSIAPQPSMATLPLTVVILSVALAAAPAAMLAKRFGRRIATLIGLSISVLGSLLAMYATLYSQFWTFVGASFCFGISLAFVQQLRFAAIESVTNSADTPKVLSMLMFAGLFAAFLGPEVVVLTRHWLGSPQGFSGTFLALAIMVSISMVITLWFKDPPSKSSVSQAQPRPMSVIMTQPIFIIAIIAGAIGYGLMSYIMTATPISMHNVNGHSLNETKWVIQSHISAMYLPSLFTPWLVKRIGLNNLMMVGTLMFVIVAVIAISGQEVMHYWWALVCLGIGWNFLFLTGTALLPQSYRPGESHKVQATNDFAVFFVQGLFSLLAGWLLFKSSWEVVVYTSLPFVLLLFMTSLYYNRFLSRLNNN